jgi:membrane protease YdiL (CAAX protease family)
MPVLWGYVSCALMALAMVAVWIPRRIYGQPCWLWLMVGAIACAFPGQLLLPIALLWIAIAFALFYWLYKKPGFTRWLLPLLAIYLFVFALGILPGFLRITVIEPELLGNSTVPYGLRVGFAKPIAGLLIFAWLARRCDSVGEVWIVIKRWPLWLLPALAVLVFAWALGVVIDIKWPWWTPLFILSNALFTALPEEAFFRSLFQQPLHRRFGNAWWIIPLVGFLFAAAHVPPTDLDMWRFFVVIFIAGTAYAWSYRQSGRVETAVLTHVAVNSLHFILLIYPVAFIR